MGSPFFRLHRRRLAERLAHFQRLGVVYYPVKANSHELVLRELADLNTCFDVDSHAAVRRLLDLDVPPSRIQFSVALKPLTELIDVRKDQVTNFVIDSAHDYFRLLELAPETCLLRLSLHDLIAVTDKRQLKWGMSIQEALDLLGKEPRDPTPKLGLSFYLPKSQYSSENFLGALHAVADRLGDSGITILDVGGGLDDSSDPMFSKAIESIRQRMNLDSIILEPGRNLLDPCIDLVANVLDVRDRFGEAWAYLDVGIYQSLLDAALIGKRFPITAARSEEGRRDGELYEYMIAGPSADTLDCLGKYSFPVQLRPGDQVIVGQAGAYTWSLRTAFGNPENLGFEVEDD